MNNQTKLLLLIYIKKYLQKRNSSRKFKLILERINLLRILTRTIMDSSVLLLSLSQETQRRYWAMKYEQSWFEKMWRNHHNDIYCKLWKKEFRMSPSTFEYIIDLVEQNMAKAGTVFRKAVPIEKRVGVGLWRLSTGNSFRTISKVFEIGKSTVIKLVNKLISELLWMSPEFIKFPKTTFETGAKIRSFHDFTGCKIPQVLGAIDGTHIEILALSSDSKVDYFNRKQKLTVNTQAVIGANLEFLDVATGYPGSVHNARALRSSTLFQQAEAQIMLSTPLKDNDNVKIRLLLLSDSAYPATLWQVKSYKQNIMLNHSQKKFNKALSSARVTTEHAFGVLKGCWRCLLKWLDNNLENIPDIILACCVLHNITQLKGDNYIDYDDVIPQVLQDQRRARDIFITKYVSKVKDYTKF